MRKMYEKFNKMTARDIATYMKEHPGSPLITEYITNLCSVRKNEPDRTSDKRN